MSQALGWEKWHAVNVRNMAPVVDWLVQAAGAGPGLRVLDVACGTGLPAIALAQRGADVVATDVSPDMLAACGRLAGAAGASLTFHERDAQALGFDDASFDAVTCSFGLMFCPDAARAVAEARRVVRPGGHVAVAVWDVPARNPFFTTIFGALAQVIPPAAPPDPRSGMFRFGPPGELVAVLAAGGLTDVRVEPVDLIMDAPSLDQHWTMFVDMAPPLQAAVRTQPAEVVARIRAAFEDAMAPHLVDGRVRVPARALCARARA